MIYLLIIFNKYSKNIFLKSLQSPYVSAKIPVFSLSGKIRIQSPVYLHLGHLEVLKKEFFENRMLKFTTVSTEATDLQH